MSEIDRLMDKWAKDYSDEDVDAIIAYVRKQLAIYDAGVKPKKIEAESIDMEDILAKIRKSKATDSPVKTSGVSKMKRRV